MGESQKDMLSRLVAETVERRQHPCERCGHPGSKHAFDFVLGDAPNPCLVSCMTCMEENNEKR